MYRTLHPHHARSARADHTLPAIVAVLSLCVSAAALDIDRSRYISPDEIRPGMKGFGRTVLSGTEIQTFNLEVVSVLRNAYYAKKDVVLIRCSGLNLEHSGIIGGMSGSPCYIRDEKGAERMFGAVAYGWTFNKDPICGVQPITEMIDVAQIRDPARRADTARKPDPAAAAPAPGAGRAVALGDLIAQTWPEPIDPASRFSFLERRPTDAIPGSPDRTADVARFEPLAIPVSVSGAGERAMDFLRDRFGRFGLVPVASGAVSGAGRPDPGRVRLEPGSALCILLMTGDIQVEALGTCTEVIGDRVLGFGHSMFGDGAVELPLATGHVHTVIPSVYRSNKVGSSLATVGTLWGDEASAVFGTVGQAPKMATLDVVVTDVRGERTFHYELAREQFMTAGLMGLGVMESIYANNNLPIEHTVRYAVETSFEGLGEFRTSNLASQGGTQPVAVDVMLPVAMMLRAPFGEVQVLRSRVEITIDEGARLGQIEEATLSRSTFEPGDTVTVRIRWFHYRHEPMYTCATYSLALPEDIPDGEYKLLVGSVGGYVRQLQSDRPHLFQVETLAETLEAMNLLGSLPENRLYMHLDLRRGGLAVKRLEMPELPSYRRQMLMQSARSDVRAFSRALVVQHETEFAVSGQRSFTINVSRRAHQ